MDHGHLYGGSVVWGSHLSRVSVVRRFTCQEVHLSGGSLVRGLTHPGFTCPRTVIALSLQLHTVTAVHSAVYGSAVFT